MIKTNRLPSAYQQVEYISPSESAYIDTGFIPDNNTAVEVKTKSSSDSSRGCILGVRDSQGHNSFYLEFAAMHHDYISDIRSEYGTNSVDYYMGENHLSYDPPTIILKDKNKLYINSVLKLTHTAQTFTCSNNLYLFKANSQDSVNSRAIMYYAKIWDNGTLIRYYIPCYRKSDNAIGMYDLVNKTFTAGTGTFTKGNDIQTPVKKIMTKVNGTMTEIIGIKSDKPILPAAYKQVEYINSTGRQCTYGLGLMGFDKHIVIESTIMVTSTTSNGDIWIGGSSGSTYYKNAFAIKEWGKENGIWYASFYTGDAYYKFEEPSKNTILNITIDAEVTGSTLGCPCTSTLTINGTEIVTLTGTWGSSSYKTQPIHLCGAEPSQNYNPVAPSIMRVYSFKMYENNVLTRDLVPCYRKSDSIPGLYDLVSGTFFNGIGPKPFNKSNISIVHMVDTYTTTQGGN